MKIELEGAVALVTGAAGDIGRAICDALERAGATVVASDRAAVLARSHQANTIALDVVDEAAWHDAVDGIRKRHGRLDILVNNAAIAPVAAIGATSLAEWRMVQAVNVEGIFLALRTTQSLLAESGSAREGGSSVINMSSAGGIVAAPFNAAYCASKGAVGQLTKAAALEFSALGQPIRVNSVHPGCVDSAMMTDIMAGFVANGAMTDMATARAGFAAAHPLGRLCRPDEVAAGVVFLASAQASFMHGSELVIDGGFLSR